VSDPRVKSSQRDIVGAQKLVGSLHGAHEVLSWLFEAGQLPETAEVERALTQLDDACGVLDQAVSKMRARGDGGVR
jgi:hypothetical protein